MATRYWVGGTGTWDASSTTNWSATSGGAGGASAPVAADTVIFDSNSGTGTCTTASGSVCAIATLNSSTLGLTLGANHTMSGLFTLTAGVLSLGSNTLTCNSFLSNNSNSRTIDFGTGNVVITGNAGGIWLTSTGTNLVISGTPVVNCTYAGSTGTRSINVSSVGGNENQAISFNISSGSDSLTVAASSRIKNLDLTGFSGTLNNAAYNVYGDFVVSSTMTLAAGANGISFIAVSPATQKITTAGKTFDFPLNFGSSALAATTIFQFQDALSMGATRALTFFRGELQLKDGVTSTVGTFATSGTTQKILESTSAGSQATLSQASGTVSANNLTIQDIAATGGATWNAFYANGNIDAGNNTGWEFGGTPAVTTELTYRLRSFTTPRRF